MAGDGLFVGQTFQSERSDGTLHVEETAMQVATKVETTDLPPAEAPNCESLMQYQGQQFVEATYVTLLKRLPDADGLNFYLGRMHDGVSKFQILREIFFSQECRDAGIELPGLREALTQADGLQ